MAAKLTNTIIEAAIDGFEAQKRRIDSQIADLRAMLGGGPVPETVDGTPEKRTRRKFSAEARKRMREAQRLRWAKARGESSAPAVVNSNVSRSKRRISAAGRKAISAAMKKRWAAKKAAAAA